MSNDATDSTSPGSDGPDYADTNDRDIRAKQNSTTSEATDDPAVEADDVKVLPGTGGPDDVGDVEVDPAELNMDGHPKQ
ncbi:MAG TPA: hypothetical protein VGP24_17725 [Glaciihabitans sp.]|jgi:hypothetical protein|nr:hypothetical protein [Glaciihabitans sp.]